MVTRTKPRINTVSPSEQTILNVLHDGSKTVREMALILNQSYHSVYQPVRNLLAKQFIEKDVEKSAFNRGTSYRVKRLPNDGIEIVISSGGGYQEVSFNVLLEQFAKGARAGNLPKLATMWPVLMQTFAYLGFYAAKEMDEPGSVTENNLLELRSALMKYGDALNEQLAIVTQLQNENRLWDPQLLKTGTLIKTDRFFTPNDVRKFSRMIIDVLNELTIQPEATASEETDVNNEGENAA